MYFAELKPQSMKLCSVSIISKKLSIYILLYRNQRKINKYMDHLYNSHTSFVNASFKFKQTHMKEKEGKSQGELVFLYHTSVHICY